MKNDQQPAVEKFICYECQTGHLEKTFITYFTWLAGELITVPDFPAWVCDVCGRREYDTAAIAQLNILLNPATGRTSRKNTRKSGISDRPSIQP